MWNVRKIALERQRPEEMQWIADLTKPYTSLSKDVNRSLRPIIQHRPTSSRNPAGHGPVHQRRLLCNIYRLFQSAVCAVVSKKALAQIAPAPPDRIWRGMAPNETVIKQSLGRTAMARRARLGGSLNGGVGSRICAFHSERRTNDCAGNRPISS
jgi:hypothetical protein